MLKTHLWIFCKLLLPYPTLLRMGYFGIWDYMDFR